MKKIILCVIVTLGIFLLLYGLWSFAYMDFNPKNWEMGSRVFYCFLATAVSAYANMGVMLCEKDKQ